MKELGFLDLPAGEPYVHLAVEEIRKLEAIREYLARDAVGVAEIEDVPGLHPTDTRRTLKGEANSHLGPLVDGRLRDIFPLEQDAALSHPIAPEAHDGHKKGRLPGAVLSEEDMSLSPWDLEVNPLEHGFPVDLHPKIDYLQHETPPCTPLLETILRRTN